MPGINCPVHPRVNPTFLDGHCYPAADFSGDPFLRRALAWGLDSPDKEVDWRAQWQEPSKWRELQQKLLATFPYPLPIPPGTAVGSGVVKVSGKPADWYQSFLGGHVFISGSALAKLEAAGVRGLFACPCEIKSKRKRDTYYELQLEHSAAFAGELVVDAMRRKYHRDLGYPLKCEACDKEWGALPEPLVLRGETIPEGVSLFRLGEKPATLLCNQAFAEAAIRLKLTNMVFVQIQTDGSENQRGFAKVSPSRPELWHRRTAAASPPKLKKRIARQTVARPASVASLIRKSPLSTRAAEIGSLVLPSLRFAANRCSEIAVGASRFAGLPDLPKTLSWPGTAEAPLDFLLQLNLSEIARKLPGNALPKSGFLWFFYDSERCPWGVNPDDQFGWKVLFYAGPASDLSRAPLPGWLSRESLLPACGLEFQKTESLPALNSPAVGTLRLSKSEREQYSRILKELRNPSGTEASIHKLLGHPDAIQNDMPIQCAMASAGFDTHFRPDLKNRRQRGAAKNARDWILLLQLDSDDSLEMQWADAGRLFFWIRKRDLEAKAFNQSWAILQTH